MGRLGIIVLVFFSGFILIFGNIHWNKTIAKEAVTKEAIASNQSKAYNRENKEKYSSLQLAGNWSEQAQTTLKNKLEQDEPFVISVVGTKVIDQDDFSIFDNVEDEVSKAYGSDVSLGKYIYEGTSIDFINDETAAKVNSAKPDMIILEPASLADNGEVRSEDAVENLAAIIETFKVHNPDVSVVLMDPLPLYEAVHYPREVEELREYAANNDIPYIHHWDKWQMDEGTEMEKYLKDDKRTPNEEGFAIWVDAVKDYLIKESE